MDNKNYNINNILWCSPHQPTPEQIEELKKFGNIMYLKDINMSLQTKLENTPDNDIEAKQLAVELFDYLDNNFNDYIIVQPAGNPMFQYILGVINSAKTNPTKILYAHSIRESIEEIRPDGTIMKKSVFKHNKFIQV